MGKATKVSEGDVSLRLCEAFNWNAVKRESVRMVSFEAGVH